MKELVFLDETIDTGLVKNYHISIQASLSGFSFCILDEIQKKYVALKHFPIDKNIVFDKYIDTIESILKKDDLLTLKGYKSLRFLANHKKVTLIPAPLFSKENLKLYLDFNAPVDELDEIYFNELKDLDTFVVFTVNSDLSNIMFRHFEGVNFYSHISPFLQSISVSGNKNTKDRVLVNINDGFVDIAVVSNDELLMCNSFEYREHSDLLYFTLNVYQQLKLDVERVPLSLMGNVLQNNDFCKEVKKYIYSVRIEKLDENYNYSYKITESDYCPHLNLLNLIKCE